MAVNLSPVGGVAAQFFTNTGAVLTGGKLYTYLAGTTTPSPAYTSSNGATPWTNPIVLDAAGRVPSSGEIWLTDGIIYKIVLKDSNDVLIATYDNITGINSNSVAYTNQQEIVTATAGQTVFPLSISYQPATNSLSVFVDGVNQYGPGAQYSYVETDANTVTFNSGLHVGAEVKFTTTQQQGAGAVDASQVTYTAPYVNSVITNVQQKLGQTVSAYDFMTSSEIADVQSYAPTLDVTAALQAAIDAVEPGQRLYIPWGFYKHSGLTVDKSVFIYGDLPPPFFDDDAYNALNKGTILWQYQSTGNNLTVEPPNLGNQRLVVHIQDVTLVGAIWNGTSFTGTPTSGHGFYFNGQNGVGIETSLQISWERIGSCYHAEHGVFITGSVYGCDAGMVTSNANGKNNFRIESTSEPIGEFTIAHIRCFSGGSLASNDIDKSSVYLKSGGMINIGFITATYATTYAVLLAGGRWNIGTIWTESLGGTVDASRVVVQFGDGSTSPSASEIQFLVSAAGSGYPGTVVKFKNGTRGNNIQQVLCDISGATGDLIVFETNSESNSISRLAGSTTGNKTLDNGNSNTYSQFYSIPSGLSASGLWYFQNIGVGKYNIGDVSTQTGHAFYTTGVANFSTNDSGAGGIAYLETNYNAGVPDGWKFHSFRIGTSPAEIGKIEVSGSGTAINYATSSDYRLKENAQPMTGALQRICELNPVTFTWKAKQVFSEGFIAHELQQVFPAAVTGKKDEVDADGQPIYQGVDASKIIAALVSAVQELTERVKQLEGR